MDDIIQIDMSNYEFTEVDIQKVLNYLTIHSPENADRDYAVQLLEQMQDKAFNIVNSGVLTDEEIEQALESNNKS
ncbi:MAG: hypothetical protein WAQ57_01185 [Candidatus Saccharimonadales bacterium]